MTRDDDSAIFNPSASFDRRHALSGLGALVLGVACSDDTQTTPTNTGGSAAAPPPSQGGSTTSNAGGQSSTTGGLPNSNGGSVSAATGGANTAGSGALPGTGGSTGGSSATTGGTAPAAGGNSGGSAGAGGGSTGGQVTGGAPAGGMAGGGAPQAGSAGMTGAGGQSGLVIPDFGATPMCTLTPTDAAGEGPFFVHDDEAMDDIPMGRPDIREGEDGVEFQMHIRVLDESKSCGSPISGVEVYIWHTNALGFYSGFGNQDPNKNYMGSLERTIENSDRFCRGMQVTNANGIVSFRTLYPGWYFGRPLHVHFLALKPGSGAGTMSYRGSQYHVFTTQFYFDEQFSRNIHENFAPYTTRASGSGYEQYVKADARNPTKPSLKLDGNIVIGSLNIITSSAASRR